MQIAPAGVPIPFEYSAYDLSTNLNVGMEIWDVTTGTPVIVGSVVPMTYVDKGTYFANYTFTANKIYVINKMVYTDNTFTTPLTTYSPGSESLQASTLESDIQELINLVQAVALPISVTGVVQNGNVLRGLVLNANQLRGVVTQ
jgi:hypothetical protein